MSCELSLRLAGVADAPVMHDLIIRAFSARPACDPPAEALMETPESIAGRLRAGAGLIASADGEDAGCLLISFIEDDSGLIAMVHRVSVLPEYREKGVAATLVRTAAELVTDVGATWLHLATRAEFPEVIGWWSRHGFQVLDEIPHGFLMGLRLPIRFDVPTPQAMHDLGIRLASIVKAGDVIVATGELGAGKTTLTQGIGEGLGVEGVVISPTFVLSRVHHSLGGGPDLVHVDAYRLASQAELEDLDLEASLGSSVTLIEWGDGLAGGLTKSWLDVTIRRSDDPTDETRIVYLAGIGERWAGVDLDEELRNRR